MLYIDVGPANSGVRAMGSKILIDLGEQLRISLEDFCEANYGAPATRIVREAVKAFIEERLAAEPETQKRYETAMARRLSTTGENVRVLEIHSRGK